MILLLDYTLTFWREKLFFAVAERSKASDLRSFDQKLEWVRGSINFFFFFCKKKNFGKHAD